MHSEKSKNKTLSTRFFNVALAAVLTAALATASVMAGCGKDSDSGNETVVVNETQIVTRIVDGVYTDKDGNVLTDENGNAITQPATEKSESSEKDEKSESSSKTEQSSSGGNSGKSIESYDEETNPVEADSSVKKGKTTGYGGNTGGSSGSSGKSSSGSSSKSGYDSNSKTLSIDGQNFNVGDTILCTYYIQCPEVLINYQGYVEYDGKCLKATHAYLQKPAKSGGISNANLDQIVKFNGVSLNGYDYVDGGAFIIIEYEVLGGGTTSPKFTWEVASDLDQKSLVSNGVGTRGLELSYTYEVKS